MLQLNPPLHCYTQRGEGMAVGWIDYGPEHDLLWIVLIAATRQFWVLPTKDVRGTENLTYGRPGIPQAALWPSHAEGG